MTDHDKRFPATAVPPRKTIGQIPTEDYRWVEKSLIRTLRPLLNIQHNG